MRPVLHGDVVTAARFLLRLPDPARVAACDRLFECAHAADRYARRFRRAHPRWGDGSLRAAAWCPDLPPEPPLRDRAYLACLRIVLDTLAARQAASVSRS